MNTRYHIYLMPGLGLSPRIFENLSIQAKSLTLLHWLEPEKKEPLVAYVHRMARLISRSQRPMALVGHSFGGVIVQEMQKLIG